MKRFHKEEGFTLVELMVVVLIIGFLVAIAIPVFNSAKKNAEKKSCFANQRTIDGACNSYQAEWGVYPAGGAAGIGDLTGGADPYLKKAPLNPGTATGYSLVGAGANAGIECNGCPTAAGDYAHGAY